MGIIVEMSNLPLIIKRDGRLEEYSEEKLYKVALWGCMNKESLAKELMYSMRVKVYNKMPIQELYDALIDAAVSKISLMFPIWDKVSSRLVTLKFYKEAFGMKNTKDYPSLSKKVFPQLVEANIISLPDLCNSQIQELARYIKPERDFLYSYKGAYLMHTKYCKKIGIVQAELPQHTYMLNAISSHTNIDLIKADYDYLSTFVYTKATPNILNNGTINPQLASCVLNTVADSTESITETDKNIAIYSKFGGGIAIDVSHIGAKGRYVKGNRGKSGGVVPFIQKFERTISAFNQGGARKGSGVISYNWWTKDVFDILPLKDAGGTEDTRARKLQYAIKLNDCFFDYLKNNQPISLLCPAKAKDLLTKTGKEFTERFEAYQNEDKVNIRELAFLITKYRKETGNLYLTLIDNINKQNMTNRYVGASNLCAEVTVPSTPSIYTSEEIIGRENGHIEVHTIRVKGEIGLCNLASINLLNYISMTQKEKMEMLYTLLIGMDNNIDTQFYPVKEGKISNQKHRPIGIGVLNMVAAMASQQIKITDEEALQWTHELFEDLYYNIYLTSSLIAKERGTFVSYEETKWSEGKTPLDISILHNQESELNFPLKRNWDSLKEHIKQYGMRFSLHGAIAPTATSGKVINATESIEPIHRLFYIEEGTQSLPTLAYNIQEFREYYVTSFNVPNKQILALAGIRQKFIDQAQSINLYYIKPESSKELWEDILYANTIGIKSLYYMKTPTLGYQEETVCESCT